MALAACLVVAVGVPVTWLVTRPEDAVGRSVVAAPAPTASAPATPSATPPARTTPALPRLTARPAVPVAEKVDPPVRLRVADVGLDAPVDPVGVDEAGAMGLPEDVDRVGWYRVNPAPGAAVGTSVLAGHVDSREQGLGEMARLLDVEVGARVVVTTRSGQRVEYRVVGRQRLAKQGLPVEDLFRRDGPARLVLVTCGGEYSRERGGYQDNVVVLAEPVR